MADENRPPDNAPTDKDSNQEKTTPEREAALTGKAPSGSSTSGTTVPASSADPSATQASDPAQVTETPAPGSQPPGGASPPVGDPAKGPSQADAEKAARIAEARAKAAAAKQAAGAGAKPAQPAGATPAAAGAPKAPVKKKEEGPKPVDASNHALVKKLREATDSGAVVEATEFVGQLSIRIERERIVEVCDFLKRDAETPFNYLSDLTAVHYPARDDAEFEVVYNLYSIDGNERVRLKVRTTAEEGVETVSGVWPAANWMEREVYDLFGITFRNHPDLRRILLPPDWEGHPLRKEYPLEFIENNWTARHLPEFTDVQREQLEQRRNYGLEELSMIEERRAREIFRAGKEILSKDK